VVDSEPEAAMSEVVHLAPQLQAGRPSPVEPVISAGTQPGAGQDNGRMWWHSRRRLDDRINGARR
jgi:hypothetical protein